MSGIDFREIQAMPPLYVRLTHSKKKVRKWHREFGADVYSLEKHFKKNGAFTTTFEREDGETVHIVWMTDCTDYPAACDAALLAHEATHIAQDYFRSIGEASPSDELQAYTVQHVTDYLVGNHFDWKQKQFDKGK